MGARLYLPTLGRFTQPDPIEGGVENNYVYPPDPVNEVDLTGKYAYAPIDIRVDTPVSRWIDRHPNVRKTRDAVGWLFIARTKKSSNPKQFTKLSESTVRKLQKKGLLNAHGAKKGIGESRADIFLDKKTGELYSKPKNGSGPGEPLNININW